MRRKAVWCALAVLALTARTAVRAEPPGSDAALKEDLKTLQGKWEYTFDLGGGASLRKVKEVKDNTERVTWYGPDGSVFRVNEVEFKLEMRGDDKVYSWFNGKVTEGDGKGLPFEDGSFIYKLDGDRWSEVLPSGDTLDWRRVKDRK